LKKKVVFWSLFISFGMTVSMFSALSHAPGRSLGYQRLLMPAAATLVLLIYYLRMENNNQLVPATINVKDQKKGNRDDKSAAITFEDVAGLEEVKEELSEVIDFIRNSEKYRKMGAKIPKGILFHGPPGTGKTLMASAVAGESNSHFIYASGSEFVEKYVGVGASRSRDLFEKAKKNTPSVVFIDEIDAIGSTRNMDNNSEKDQTLNQLLVEMDGFKTNENVVIIAATNRIDLLDPALLRPGRFDRHMFIGNPNVKAREEILRVHTRNKPLDPDVDIRDIAKKTHGVSGAHLASIANEAAILAVRKNKASIGIDEFNQAIERVLVGLQKKNADVMDREKNIVAYHESGHALVGKFFKNSIIEKISILPRGQAMGYVLNSPGEDRYLHTSDELEKQICVLLGGRAAEELIFGEVTTGAKDDLSKANDIAQQMVCEFGMSSLGNRVYRIDRNGDIHPLVEREIKKIIDRCYQNTKAIIASNRDYLERIAAELKANETITGTELDAICNF
jgi:cell division protease FtsH